MTVHSSIYLAIAALCLSLATTAGAEEKRQRLYTFETGPEAWGMLKDGVPTKNAPGTSASADGGQALRVAGTTPGTFGAAVTYWNPTITDPVQLRELPSVTVEKVWPAGSESSDEERAAMGRWAAFTHLTLRLRVPADAPAQVRAIVDVFDAELNHYQHVDTHYLEPGEWRTLKLDMTAFSHDWQAVGHHKPWDGYCRQEVTSMGVRVTSDQEWPDAAFMLDDVALTVEPKALAQRNQMFNLRENTVVPPIYSKFELSFNLTRTYSNPYDPEEVDVQGHFIDPDGETESVPGFFYQGYQRTRRDGREVLTPMGRSHWKVRYAPRKVGRYHYYVTVDDGVRLRTDVGSFMCVAGDDPGFVRISEDDPDYFEFDNGDLYYPIGHNIASVRDTRAESMGVRISDSEGTFAYDRFLSMMSRNGENFGRVWLTPWSFEIEWTKAYQPHFAGLGRYSQYNSWRLDHLVETAHDSGVYLMLLIASHGEITTYESNFKGGKDSFKRNHPEWGSPYWKYNGGPLESPDTFYTDTTVLAYYKRQLRYIAARWGYSTAVMAWEMLNEPDLHSTFHANKAGAARFGPQCSAFLSATFQHLRTFDPAHHLRTTNVWQHWSQHTWPVLRTEELDFYAAHMFNGNLPDFMRTGYDNIKSQTRLVTFTTEADSTPFARTADQTMRYIKVVLWSSYMMPHPGAACPWWWVLIDGRNGYGYFKALAKFAEGEERRGMQYVSQTASVRVNASRTARRRLAVECLGNGSKAFCWIYDSLAFSQQANWTDPERTGATLVVSGMNTGDYDVEIWDTDTGEVTKRLKAKGENRVVVIEVPEFESDVAVKIRPAASPVQPAPVVLPQPASRPERPQHELPD